MRSRIIFRGLTLFTFERNWEDAGPNENLGTLTAWLVSDPEHVENPLHRHSPRYAIVGRDVADPTGKWLGTPNDIVADMTIQDICYDPTGVVVDRSFLDYVPCLDDLRPDVEHSGEDATYIQRRITIPRGRIRAGEFISWDWYGKTPVRVGYMGTRYGGFATNEVIVDIGDDDDMNNVDDPKCYLEITHGKAGGGNKQAGKQHKAWPLVKRGEMSENMDPNTVEVLISNLPARRRRPVFWGLHFQTLFQAAGYPPDDYMQTPQFVAFEAAARAYDAYEWRNDSGLLKAQQPFPFIIDPRADRLARIAEAPQPYVVHDPPPTPASVRQSGEGIPAGTGGKRKSHGGMGHDPLNREICPFASAKTAPSS